MVSTVTHHIKYVHQALVKKLCCEHYTWEKPRFMNQPKKIEVENLELVSNFEKNFQERGRGPLFHRGYFKTPKTSGAPVLGCTSILAALEPPLV